MPRPPALRRLAPVALLALFGCDSPREMTDGAVDAAQPRSDASGTDATTPVADAAPQEDSGGSADASEPGDSAAPDAAPAIPDGGGARVGVFAAQGYMGRTTISCDDGRTWVANRSDDDAVRCFSAGVDCDHNGGRAMGITGIDGVLAATWGWGAANSVRVSRDGAAWNRALDRTIFSGIESGAGRIVAISNTSQVSQDFGARWTPSNALGFVGHIRATGVLAGAPQRFVAAGGENGATVGDVMISEDGARWARPMSVPRECGQGVVAGGIATGGNISVITHESGLVCVSTDGGQRWTTARADGINFEGTVLWTGRELVTWGRSMALGLVHLRSTDGLRWTPTALTARNPDGSRATTPRVNTVARSPSGTFVTVHGEWNSWYDRQQFYRSADGITWEALPRTAFTGSHPIRFITYAEVSRSAAGCR